MPTTKEEIVCLNLYGSRYNLKRDDFTRLFTNSSGLRKAIGASEQISAPSSDDIDKYIGCEFYLKQQRGCFEAVVFYLKTGDLHLPPTTCVNIFIEELKFWGIDLESLSDCCYYKYKSFVVDMESLKRFNGASQKPPIENHSKLKFKEKIRNVLEDPYSSIYAKVYACVAGFFICLAIFLLCASSTSYFTRELTLDEWADYLTEEEYDKYGETLQREYLNDVPDVTPSGNESNTTFADIHSIFKNARAESMSVLVLNKICLVFFTLEIVVRFSVRSSVCSFLKNPFNIFDFLALLSIYSIEIIEDVHPREGYSWSYLDMLQILNILRVFRIFRLMKHVKGFQVLMTSLMASIREVCLLLCLISTLVIIYSTLLFVVEDHDNIPSIPAAFWWAIITMTTVGYGDVVPKSAFGKVVSSLCAVTGILTLAIVAPIFVNNFLLFYNYSRGMKQPNQKESVEQMKDTNHPRQIKVKPLEVKDSSDVVLTNCN